MGEKNKRRMRNDNRREVRENIRDAIEIVQFIKGYDEVSLDVLFDIKFNSRKNTFSKNNLLKEGEYKGLPYGDISRKYDIITDKIDTYISKEIFENATLKLMQNDLIINLEDFRVENSVRCLLYTGKEEVMVNGDIAILKLDEVFKELVDLEYISYIINYSKFFRQQVEKSVTGTKVVRIPIEKFKELKVYVPKITAQKNIVEKLNIQKKSIKKIFENKDKFGKKEKVLKNRIWEMLYKSK